MAATKPEIHRLFLTPEASGFALTERILNRLPDAERIEVAHAKEAIAWARRQPDLWRAGKESLILTTFAGDPVKRCPGSDGMLCCNYWVMNIVTGCPFDCSYCILQDYLANNPVTQIFVNVEEMRGRLDAMLTEHEGKHIRIGTGELADSLALEPLTGHAAGLLEVVRRHPHAVLELKTKSNHIDELLKLEHNGQLVIGFSLMPPSISVEEEPYTAPVEERIEAAARAARAGIKVAFHFDPIVLSEDWEPRYLELIDMLCERVPPGPQTIGWISMGGLRMTARLEKAIRARWRNHRIYAGEFFQGADGKLRYERTLRTRVYRTLKERLESHGSSLALYLCMESKTVWQDVFGALPLQQDTLVPIYKR